MAAHQFLQLLRLDQHHPHHPAPSLSSAAAACITKLTFLKFAAYFSILTQNQHAKETLTHAAWKDKRSHVPRSFCLVVGDCKFQIRGFSSRQSTMTFHCLVAMFRMLARGPPSVISGPDYHIWGVAAALGSLWSILAGNFDRCHRHFRR